MSNGAQVNNLSDFLDNAKLAQYKEQLSNIMNLSLNEIKDITDEELSGYGIEKEFHRKRFLRHASKMKPISPLIGGTKKKKRKSKRKLSRKRKYTKKNKLSKKK